MPDSDQISEPAQPSDHNAAPDVAAPEPAAPGAAAPPLIVAIGASAGGLAAFKRFFARMPAESGMAFVLVQHLDPHYQSMLVEILARTITMPVIEAADGMTVAPDTIYVIPPDATLTIAGGALHVEHPAPARLHRWPINTFFTALAEDQNDNAVGIVLTGVGSDGAAGVAAIKAYGGLTLAQSEYDHVAMSGMPENATATGYVDFVLSIEEMPERLIRYRRHLLDGGVADDEEALPIVISLLRSRLGHDFSGYKTSTILRRIQRRMQVLALDSMEAFIDRLRREPAQLDLLFSELLIGVTQFMRDPAAFAALRTLALPDLFKDKGERDHLRVWVPGCSTGEEVYSLAILLREAAEQAGAAPKIQIFGTDIDEAAINRARLGQYPSVMKGLDAAQIARWFVEDGDCCGVAKQIREMCVFSVHNLIKDPPFSRLHLVSCRNLLIYMNGTLQEQVIRIFHYALQPEGILFLGPSEGITRGAGLFRTLERRHRIYQRRAGDAPAQVPEIAAELPLVPHSGRPTRPGPAFDDRIDKAARAVLERHSPAFVVVNEHHDIIRFSGGEIGRFLEPSTGAASLGLFANLRKSLRPTVRTALQTAFGQRHAVLQEHVPIEVDGELRTVSIIAEPILNSAAGGNLCVVAFRDFQRMRRRRGVKGASEVGAAALQAMEAELLATKARLQLALEAAETAGEETRSSVEEYQSVNEELQSSNEELETAKEEMQSINEELQTINTELATKNDQLVRLNNDVQNLLESTRIATIFLDGECRIKSFTPPMQALFNLRASDHGRPLSDIAARLAHPDFWQDIRAVIDTGIPAEREVRTADGLTTFIMRVMPYNTGSEGTDGVVLTFVDITAQKRTEQSLRDQTAIVEFAHDAFMRIDFDGTIRSWNPAAGRLYGYAAAEVVGQPVTMLCAPEYAAEQTAMMEKARSSGVAGPVETVRRRKDGRDIEIDLTIVPIPGETGEPVAFASSSRDIATRRRTDDHRELLLHELAHRVKNALATVQSMTVQTMRNAKSLDGFSEVFLGRLIALASTHDLLIHANWQGATLIEVLEAELKPYRPRDCARWTITGPEVRLNPKTALALGMAFHELATNAVKYGALSVPAGKLLIDWTTRIAGGGSRLHLSWTEQGGPTVTPPEHRGFGSRLITDGLAYELDGQVDVIFDPEGVRCVIDVPLVSMEDDL